MSSLNTHITRQMIQDLKNFEILTSIFKYKIKNKKESRLIHKYFIVDYDNLSEIFFKFDEKVLRKIKLLKLNSHKDSILLEYIIKNSKKVSTEEYIENKLVEELAKEINKEILNTIIS